jgi:VIT1/CCC1 family predicted Fe2+/Mn2+ transporter
MRQEQSAWRLAVTSAQATAAAPIAAGLAPLLLYAYLPLRGQAVIAGMIVTPVLVGVANAVGVLTGLVSARATMGLGPEGFLYGARMYRHSWDLF